MASPSTEIKSKRRWVQFSLRTGFIIVTALCVALSMWVVPAERRRRAVVAIEAQGGFISYADQKATSKSFPFAFLRRWFPRVYFDEIEWLSFGAEVTDAELAHLQGLTSLQWLNLTSEQVTDAGLAHLQRLTKLRGLDLDNTQVTDAGLAHLQRLTSLRELSIASDIRVTDAGLAHLKRLTCIQLLDLNNTQVTDAGLAHLQGLTGLRGLILDNTQVTDAGLTYLQRLTSLESLGLGGTEVTDSGVAKLRQALPKCKIIGP